MIFDSVWDLDIVDWNLFESWCLKFGISAGYALDRKRMACLQEASFSYLRVSLTSGRMLFGTSMGTLRWYCR